jgi:hypothetical protein
LDISLLLTALSLESDQAEWRYWPGIGEIVWRMEKIIPVRLHCFGMGIAIAAQCPGSVFIPGPVQFLNWPDWVVPGHTGAGEKPMKLMKSALVIILLALSALSIAEPVLADTRGSALLTGRTVTVVKAPAPGLGLPVPLPNTARR